MESKQKYIKDELMVADYVFVEEISGYEISLSKKITDKLTDISKGIPPTDSEVGFFGILVNDESLKDRYFLIHYVNEEGEPIVLLFIEEVDINEYLDLILEGKIIK